MQASQAVLLTGSKLANFCHFSASLMTRVAFLRALGTAIKLTEERCKFCIENIHFRDACGYPLKKRTLFPEELEEIELKNSKASVRPALSDVGLPFLRIRAYVPVTEL